MNICILIRPIEKFSVFEITFCIFYGKIWKYWHQNLFDIIHTTVIIDFTTLWVEKMYFYKILIFFQRSVDERILFYIIWVFS